MGNVLLDFFVDRLLVLFVGYGEIEEGLLGFDKFMGWLWGFVLIIYKMVEVVKRVLLELMKIIDGI